MAPEELAREQLLHVQKLVEHAHENVPLYRERLSAVRKIPLGELTLERFRASVPILTREELRDASDDIRARAVSPAHRPNGMRTTTSGSTGRPITTEGSRAAVALAHAQQERFHRWHRRDPNLATAFVTQPVVPEREGVWSLHGRGPARYYSLARPVAEQLDWLVRERPSYLVSYPSNVRALARLSLERGVTLPGLSDVTVSSEPVTEELRALVERAWGTKLVATYSASEVGGIALQGPTGTDYLVQAEFVLVEVIGQNGAPCAPGESGRVVVTDLHGAHRPLLRYAIGDYATVGKACGGELRLPRLERVLGRERNLLRLPDGGEIWPYFELAALEPLRALRQWQLVQCSLKEIEVRVVVARPLDASEQGVVRRVVEQSLPGHFFVTLREVAEIPRGPGGKFEEFVCALGSSSRAQES